MTNRLAGESSPYLLQHKDNPVDWRPWNEEAIEYARSEKRPIFLSIGYSACHWCHVMEHESFESDEIARKLNDHFVSIKVDREERPDLDQIYMHAVQLLTGRGGWPMSVFLTPDLQPFHGGTYWPPTARGGMPGFDQILDAVIDAWSCRNDQVLEGATQLTDQIRKIGKMEADGELSAELIDSAATALERVFDFQHGGFGQAPKFPHSIDLQVLLRYWTHHRRRGVLDMVRLTLDRMAAGGIYDHLGGGFARYAVDERWLVPHFEKMLYDNALLASVYLDFYQVKKDPRDETVIRETLDYVLREMTDSSGGFYSTEDADSEGEEGKFYVWTPAELVAILGEESAKTFAYVYDVSEEGNFEDKNILNLPKTIAQCAKILDRDEESLIDELVNSRQKLFEYRDCRVHPGKDDKILMSWNGLMIDILARASSALDEPRYYEAARKATDFLLTQLRRDDGRLLHTWRNGRASLGAYLDDYASLAGALVSLYEAGFQESDIEHAVELVDRMLDEFEDSEAGGFFFTAMDHEALIVRNKDFQDSSTPSGNALAATVLVRLGRLTGRSDYLEAAERTLQLAREMMERHPAAAGQLILALDMHLAPAREIVLIADRDSEETRRILRDLSRRFLPNKVVALRAPDEKSSGGTLDKLFAGRETSSGKPTLFVCEGFTCQAPVIDEEAILATWEKMAE